MLDICFAVDLSGNQDHNMCIHNIHHYLGSVHIPQDIIPLEFDNRLDKLRRYSACSECTELQ